MTREQTIAKALLTALGIHFSLAFCVYLSLAIKPAFAAWLVDGSALILIGLLAYAFIFCNHRWVLLIAPTESEQPVASTLWQVAVLRTTLVFCGLLLFRGSIDQIPQVFGFIILSTGLRQAIQTMIVSGPLAWFDSLEHPLWEIWQTVKLLLSLYLLAGAPGFVRAQIKPTYPACEGSTSL